MTGVAGGRDLRFFLLALIASQLSVQNPFGVRATALMTRGSSRAVDRGLPVRPFLARHRRTWPRRVFGHFLYGLRAHLWIGVLGMLSQAVLGRTPGWSRANVGGGVDGLIIRIADVQLTPFPRS